MFQWFFSNYSGRRYSKRRYSGRRYSGRRYSERRYNEQDFYSWIYSLQTCTDSFLRWVRGIEASTYKLAYGNREELFADYFTHVKETGKMVEEE